MRGTAAPMTNCTICILTHRSLLEIVNDELLQRYNKALSRSFLLTCVAHGLSFFITFAIMCRMCTNVSLTRGDRGHESNITAYDAPVTDAASKCDTGVRIAPQKQVSHSVSIPLCLLYCLCRLSGRLLSHSHVSFGAGKLPLLSRPHGRG